MLQKSELQKILVEQQEMVEQLVKDLNTVKDSESAANIKCKALKRDLDTLQATFKKL
jgi:hypothetical protein